jgi:predicted RNA-binding Zn ribbon-like protein
MEYIPAAGEDESCALALVNTRRVRDGRPADLLGDPEEAAEWLARLRLLPAGARLAASQAATLRALRESIRALFVAGASGSAPAHDDLATVNAALAAAPAVASLSWDAAGPRRDERATAVDPVGIAFARLAGDAVEVLTRADGAGSAPCGAHGCIRWFLRTHGARHWCSTRCGDRVRAARHYARHRPG